MGDIDVGGLVLLALVFWAADRTPGQAVPPRPRWSFRDLFGRRTRTDP